MNSNTSAAVHSTHADTTEAADALMKSLRHPAENEIQALRALVLQVHPTIREGVKWNAPSFRTSEYFATTNLRTKVGVSVVLHFGAKVRNVGVGRESIKDPQKPHTECGLTKRGSVRVWNRAPSSCDSARGAQLGR